jgi:hypothetical protein
MSEIDPQSDSRLTEALRRLTASSQGGAPPEIGAGLLTAFRRRHARRRLVRRMRVAALAACLLLAASLWMRRPSHPPPRAATVSVSSPGVRSKAPERTVTTSGAATTSVAAAQPRPVARRASPKAPWRAAANPQFVALPAYDPRIPLDELRVVRVQLPASALWQMGAPLNSDTANRRMLADFVVGQDGTPYAVRLLQ